MIPYQLIAIEKELKGEERREQDNIKTRLIRQHSKRECFRSLFFRQDMKNIQLIFQFLLSDFNA